jgi:hypothetical protein
MSFEERGHLLRSQELTELRDSGPAVAAGAAKPQPATTTGHGPQAAGGGLRSHAILQLPDNGGVAAAAAMPLSAAPAKPAAAVATGAAAVAATSAAPERSGGQSATILQSGAARLWPEGFTEVGSPSLKSDISARARISMNNSMLLFIKRSCLCAMVASRQFNEWIIQFMMAMHSSYFRLCTACYFREFREQRDVSAHEK